MANYFFQTKYFGPTHSLSLSPPNFFAPDGVTNLCRMLDILEKFLIRKGYCFSRLDGSTPTGLRQSLVDDFNSSPSKQVNIAYFKDLSLKFGFYFLRARWFC